MSRRRDKEEAELHEEASALFTDCYPHASDILNMLQSRKVTAAKAWAALSITQGMLMACIERSGETSFIPNAVTAEFFEIMGHEYMASLLDEKAAKKGEDPKP